MTTPSPDYPAPPAMTRELGRGQEWSVAEYVCSAGPGDRPFEERRTSATIAVVLEGTFTYTCDTGTSLLHPGAFLLGNPDTCFECGHDHGVGDRCVAFHFAPDQFAEVAASVGGGSGFRFTVGMLPVPADALGWLASIEARLPQLESVQTDETVLDLLERVVRVASSTTPHPARLSARDTRQIMAAVRHIDEHASEPMSLAALAALAGMSKYHFLRSFKRAIGATPYQLLLSVRLRRAAAALLASDRNVSDIAFDAGFADLSTFNNRFKARFGESPSRFRRRA